jgi:hypothetical protein
MHLAENAIATSALYSIAEWDESETRRCEEEQEPIAVTLIPSEEMARLRLEYNAQLTLTSGSPRGGSSLVMIASKKSAWEGETSYETTTETSYEADGVMYHGLATGEGGGDAEEVKVKLKLGDGMATSGEANREEGGNTEVAEAKLLFARALNKRSPHNKVIFTAACSETLRDAADSDTTPRTANAAAVKEGKALLSGTLRIGR